MRNICNILDLLYDNVDQLVIKLFENKNMLH